MQYAAASCGPFVHRGRPELLRAAGIGWLRLVHLLSAAKESDEWLEKTFVEQNEKSYHSLCYRLSIGHSYDKDHPIMRIYAVAAVIMALLGLAACSSWGPLTDIDNTMARGPAASDCAQCHAAQYMEWRTSAHAGSFTNPAFQQAYAAAGDNDCLICHAPLGIRGNAPEPRAFHIADGVDCLTCHYLAGKMHGPHAASAMFQPHPVEEGDLLYLADQFCARCHDETSKEKPADSKDLPQTTCLSCHAAPTSRTASQGSGLFSDMLVSFEEPVTSHSHAISLERLDPKATAIPLRLVPVQGRLLISNGLPHNLPTGTFGDKAIELQVTLLDRDQEINRKTIRVSDAAQPLSPRQQKMVELDLNTPGNQPDTLVVTLLRTDNGGGFRQPVVLLRQTFPLMPRQF